MKTLSHSLDWERICKALKLPYRKRSTGVIITPCPFHNERTPSLVMWPDTGIFRCYGCGKSGDQMKFLLLLLSTTEDNLDLENMDYYDLCETKGQLLLDLGPFWNKVRKLC